MPSGTGDIVGEVRRDFSQSFRDIVVISQNVQKFEEETPNFDVADSTNFNQPFTDASTKLTDIKECSLFDVQDSVALDFLNGVAEKSYTLNAACTNSANVNSDSWVASKDQMSCQTGIA